LHDILQLSRSRGSFVLPYEEADIRRCLGYELDKGRPYQRRGAVRDLRADKGGKRLVANVQGTRRRPYRVCVEIKPGQSMRLSGQCSCPVAIDCKHVAAVFLEALSNPPQEIAIADPLGGSLAGWLDRLRRGSSKPARPPEEIVFRIDVSPQPGRPFTLDLRVVRVLKSGTYGADRACPSALDISTARYVQPEDRLIARLLRGSASGSAQLPDDPDALHLLMHQIVATGRCRWRDIAGPPLALGPQFGGETSSPYGQYRPARLRGG